MMKRLLSITALLCAFGEARADKLSSSVYGFAAQPLVGNELVYCVQGGTTKKCLATDVAKTIAAAGPITGNMQIVGQIRAGSSPDWLATYAYFGGGSGSALVESDATGVVGSVRTINHPSAAGYGAGVVAWMFQDNATYQTQGAAAYLETRRMPTALGPALTVESEITEFGTSQPVTPYAVPAYSALSVNQWWGAGGGCNGSTYTCYNSITGATNLHSNDASGFLYMFSNGAHARSGITFGSNALTGNVGDGFGSAPAIQMPNGDYLGWFSPDGVLHTVIYGANTAGSATHRLAFVDTGMFYQNLASVTLFSVSPVGQGFFAAGLVVTGLPTSCTAQPSGTFINVAGTVHVC